MISFIMMAKNVSDYISDSIKSLQNQNFNDWELIVVDDNSIDETFNIAFSLSKDDSRIRVLRNPYIGKVKGTNFGYSMSKGDLIKCIDSDDILCPTFFDFIPDMLLYDAHIHSGFITDNNLNILHSYHPNPLLINATFQNICEKLISPPKWSWSFKRSIGDQIFPIPTDLPFEDVWLSLMIKKCSKSIYRINSSCYYYRQHSTQTFGGIMSFDPKVRVFRATRLINLINLLNKENRLMSSLPKNVFNDVLNLNNVLCQQNPKLFSVFKVSNSISLLVKNIVIIYFNKFASRVLSYKWKLDNYL